VILFARPHLARLCRLMCGKAPPFRCAVILDSEAAPPTQSNHSLELFKTTSTERQSLSAHQAAEPIHRRRARHRPRDLEDPRYFSDAQLKNRIDAYFEALHQKAMSRLCG